MLDASNKAAKTAPSKPAPPGIMSQFFGTPAQKPLSPRPALVKKGMLPSASKLAAPPPQAAPKQADARLALPAKKKPLRNTFHSYEEYVSVLTPVVLDEVIAEMKGAMEESAPVAVRPPEGWNCEGEFQYMSFKLEVPGRGQRVEHGDCIYVCVTTLVQNVGSSTGAPRPSGGEKAGGGGWEKIREFEFYGVAMSGDGGGFKLRLLRSLPEVAKLMERGKAATRRQEWKATKLKPLGPCIREWRALKKVTRPRNCAHCALCAMRQCAQCAQCAQKRQCAHCWDSVAFGSSPYLIDRIVTQILHKICFSRSPAN